ncbi:MAG: single-stranded DNA-binding protein [Bacteriovorax sp.]|nr:single-stranded DNA-binding protein [Bacteriovorax sp.]
MLNNTNEIFSGRLGRDPYLAYTKKGEAVCEISIGSNGPRNETIWKKIVAFGKLAEQCSVHLRKGNEIFVRGHKDLKKFTDSKGIEREYFEILAKTIAQSLL